MQIKHIWKATKLFVKDNDSLILTSLAAVGVVTTTFFAFEGGKNAEEITAEHERRSKVPLTAQERFLLTWKCYAPATIMAILSIGAIIGAQRLNGRKQAALAAAYGLAQKSLMDYREEVEKLVGPKKTAAINEATSARAIAQTQQPSEAAIIITGDGEQLCFETWTSRYFKSSAEKIRRAENEFNKKVFHEGYGSLNEFYEMIGLPPSDLGEQLGWTSDSLLDLVFDSHLTPDDKAALAISFRKAPNVNYWRVGRG